MELDTHTAKVECPGIDRNAKPAMENSINRRILDDTAQ